MSSVEGIPKSEPVVLLVEDDVFVRFTTSEMLREEGFVVVEAVNAAEALALISTGLEVDIVLSDVRMPGEIDGVALTAKIKTIEPLLPVALVSTHLPPDVKHEADAFLAKPFRVAELLELVRSLVGTEWLSKRSSLAAS
ncbi:response regulator [Allosphingosinicella deserti]|uniref:Response regulator n=1 Tax=Allosphingosinicella deserti TaxID=2116704 RepID=A0A2P7QNR6_9SPHN|nr:response regulator [Sphingomonas deserti]PSJ39609.1 response regulator [Sphingomonas deserti]